MADRSIETPGSHENGVLLISSTQSRDHWFKQGNGKCKLPWQGFCGKVFLQVEQMEKFCSMLKADEQSCNACGLVSYF